jgi:uncharacterized protein
MQPTPVEFQSEGVTVRGDLYLPESGTGPYPTVVMAGGWCYVKELIQPEYGKYFVEAGYACLIIDYRRLGASDGEPRQHLHPWDQIEDYRNAITYVQTRTDLDGDRIGVWGISYSGGHALIVGALDPRVRCVVSTIPVVDGLYNMRRAHGTVGFRRLRQLISEDRKRRFETGEYGYMTMSGPPDQDDVVTWPYPETRPVFEQLRESVAPRHEHRNTIASTEMLLAYNVFPYVPELLDKPTMMVLADDDDLTMWEREVPVFNAIGTPKKKLVVTGGTDHMTLYSDKSRLQVAAEASRDWFSQWL